MRRGVRGPSASCKILPRASSLSCSRCPACARPPPLPDPSLLAAMAEAQLFPQMDDAEVDRALAQTRFETALLRWEERDGTTESGGGRSTKGKR